jgi:hypothetical protein
MRYERRSRLNKSQMQTIHDYVYEYKTRGVIGTWWYFAEAVEVALKELKSLRRFKREHAKISSRRSTT